MAEFEAVVLVEVDVLEFEEVGRRFGLRDFEGELVEECLGDKDLSGEFDSHEEAERNALDRFDEVTVVEAPMTMSQLVFGE
jgi:hypothetical protein